MLTRKYILSKDARKALLLVSFLSPVVLFAMSVAFILVADSKDLVSSPVTMNTLFPHGYIDDGVNSALRGILVPSGTMFLMDGGIDKWVYVLFEKGFGYIGWSNISVQEPGILYLYVFALSAFGSYHPYFLLLVNWAVILASAVVLFFMARNCCGERVAQYVTALFLIIPEGSYWGGAIYKDGIVSLLILCIAYANLIAVKSTNYWCYVLVVLLLFALAFLRSGLVVPISAAVVLAHFLFGKQVALRSLPLLAFMLMSAIVFGRVLPENVAHDIAQRSVGRVLDKLQLGSSQQVDIENISYARSKERSLVETKTGGDIALTSVYFIPVRILSYFMAPFPPIFLRFSGDLFIIPSTYSFLFISAFFMKGVTKCLVEKDRSLALLLLYFSVTGVAIAFAGPFVYERYRLVITPFYICIAVTGWFPSTKRQRYCLLALSGLLLALASATWWVVK